MRISQTLSMVAAMALALTAACKPQTPGTAPAPAAGQTQAASLTEGEHAFGTPPSGSTAAGVTSPTSSRVQCYLAVDGEAHVDGDCLVFPFGDGGYTLNAWSDGKPARSHFAVIVKNPDGTGDATWNEDPDDARAGDRLGTVHFADGCWSNARTRICAEGVS